ncbi:MAG: SAP domain-containing protein [Methanomassiliicoccaceae archaeon]|nr:SAP domain-containing protein [Methanomassiliicoccaceae archaeon]
MTERPDLNKNLDSGTFRSYYYLKEELVRFCRQEGLRVSGGKEDLTKRISYYLDTGKELAPEAKAKPPSGKREITEDTLIESVPSYSERHRAFFEQRIGKRFTFNVAFQKWLRSNAGKSYGDAVIAYHSVMEEKKKGKTEIGRQFEYNTYIRDFFADNDGKSLDEAIRCWKYKKGLQGSHKYEREDLTALDRRQS